MKSSVVNNKCFRCVHCFGVNSPRRCRDLDLAGVKRPPEWKWVRTTDTCSRFESKSAEELAANAKG